MVATRRMGGGTNPKTQPKPAVSSKAEKAAKAAKVKAEKEAKKAERAAAKAVNDAKKAAIKAQKDAEKAAVKAQKDAEKVKAKAASTKSSTKRKPASKTKAAKVTKVAKPAKSAKTSKKAKATKSRGRTVANQYDEDEDEDNEEAHDEPPAKRRKISTPPKPRVEVGPPKEKRPAFQIGKWEYTMNTYLPEGLENAKNRPLPHIYIGGTAPQPRWVITQSESIQVPVKRPYTTNARSSSRERRDVGGLQWTFEEGDFKKWSGLEYPALYELAYLRLEYTLTDSEVREEIYDSLAQGLPKEVTKGDTWYPALPPIPITRHFLGGSSAQPSRKSSDTAFYFGNYERPNMAVQPRDVRFAQLYPQAVASNLLNRPNLEPWPTASRSPSPDSKSEPGNEDGSDQSQPVEPYLERNPEEAFSEPTAAINEGITDDEDSLAGRSRGSSVSEAPDLEPIDEDTYSEPTTPVSLGDNEHARLDTMSQDGSIFGDDNYDAAQVKPSSDQDSREQSPNSLHSGSGSDSEVSASSKTSGPSMVNAADDNSAQSTNSLSPVSHDGLFSPEEIERYYSERNRVFEQARLGGIEHQEAPEVKSQARPSPDPGSMSGKPLRVVTERAKVKTGAPVESNKRNRIESPSTPSIPSPPTSRRKTASEIKVDKVTALAEAAQNQRAEMRAAAAEKVSDKPPVPLLKKTQNWTGARSQARAPSPEILPNLQDRFLEETKRYLVDPTQRARHFPDPIAVRRVRVWAGEEMASHEIKPTVDATLAPWAERHRPFSQWQVPTGITPGPAARAKVSRPRKRSKGQSKRRPRPASAKEQSVSSARWSSFR